MAHSPESAAMRKRLARALLGARPRTPEALWQFVRALYGLAIPRRAVCPGHAAPMAYLEHAILHPGRDLVVWASRGGAKTELGSIATHLDSIFHPGCQTRILGGSLDQSQRMYEYLSRKWDGPLGPLLERAPTARRTELANGSVIEILTQSARSVRGQRVHRLKCDEVDEFSPKVWQAAQFVTQSGPGRDGRPIPAQMEVFSTLHRPFGLMAELVDRITSANASLAAHLGGRVFDTPNNNTRPARSLGPFRASGAANEAKSGPLLLRWCLWEVIERCPPDRSCSRCPLEADCGGRARQAEGYFPIADAIAQKARASRAAWDTEMLCLRPRGDRLVFGEFDPRRHIAPVGFDANLPLYRALDFGYANPFVCLWVQVDGASLAAHLGGRVFDAPNANTRPASGAANEARVDADLSNVQVRVLAEYVARERPIAEHIHEMAARDPGPVLATYADPAGWQRSDITGTGPCQELTRLGLRPRTPRAGILEGVELLRRLLKDRPGGAVGLVIDPSCRWLCRAFQEYHWIESGGGDRREAPAKDGADHPIDALRYLVTGLFLKRGTVKERVWW